MARRKIIAAIAGMAVVLTGFAGCSAERTPATTDPSASGGEETTVKMVGITMPTKSLERWNKDGAELERLLKEAGYETQLDYADNKPEEQVKQLENQINAGANILVVASIESKALIPTLAKAKEKGIIIIAYDRLLMDTKDVDYYATFDNEKVGNLQGDYIIDQLDLNNAAGPFNIEMFAGSPDDNNAGLFFKGAYDKLTPFLENGKLVSQSGKVPATLDKWTEIGILAWKSETAQNEMENRLNSFYTSQKVDVVLSPNDSLALGIAQALEGKGYKVGSDWPVLTGQDCDTPNIKNILADKQSMCVWKDTRKLAAQVAKMIDQIASGATVDSNNDTYDNDSTDGVNIVPTYLLDPQVVTKDKVQSDLVDSGFVSADAIK
ncbi:MAG: sugar-binding protein [Propionibacteriaceae bacterium]|jgi:putative multiple sugar transport system substrate-binding protein|nr:sugar-binding protein [Propionibacteriaceae bacterium]